MVERSKSERCPTRAEARPSYSIFVMMRRKKLMLASKISSLPSAIAFAERLRRDRFHDPEAIQIMDDVTHTVVDATADGAAPTEPAIFTPVASRPPRERMDLGATQDLLARYAEEVWRLQEDARWTSSQELEALAHEMSILLEFVTLALEREAAELARAG